MSEELKIKVGVDLSAVGDSAGKIPDMVEREARRKNRPRIKQDQLKIWDEIAGKWSRVNLPPIPGLPANRTAPTPAGYRQPIGPGLPGMPGTSSGYNKPIGPGLPGMPGGALPKTDTGNGKWADDFRGKLLSALEKSVLRMVVPVHLINRLTNFFITTLQTSIQKAKESIYAARATGESLDTTMRLGQAGERFGIERSDMFAILEEAKQKLGKGTFRGGEAVIALQRLGFTIEQVRGGSVNSVDVLKKLADQYKKTGANAQLAAVGSEIFGSNFQKLIPLLQNGSDGIDSLMKEMYVMEEGTARVLMEMSMAWKTFMELMQALVFDLLALIPRIVSELDDSLRLARAMGIGDVETREEATKVLEEISQQADRWGTGMRAPGESMEAFLSRFEKDYLLNERSVDMEDDEKEVMLEALKEFRKTLKPDVMNTGSLPMATSLQAMGGGDVLSAIQRNPVDEIARSTAETAANTAIMASQVNKPDVQTTPSPIITE
jgi:hypothetical protein